ADWLALVDGSQQGTGNGQVKYDARETSGPTRTGTLVVAGQTVAVTQGQGCATSITPSTQNIGANGGTATVAVMTTAGCSWSAQTNAPWIAIASGQSGTGPGTVTFSVSASDGPARSGTVTIDGHVVTVAQASGCRVTLDPASQSIGDGGGSGVVNVHASAGCAWTAASSAPWIAIAGPSTGT